MRKDLSIAVAGKGDQWEQISSRVEQFGAANGWPDTLMFTIRLILEELVVNAVNYGTGDHSTEVCLDLQSDPDCVRMRLSDNGVAYNSLEEAPEPEFTGSVEAQKVGGMGVLLVKEFADEINYSREAGLNVFTIVKLRDNA